MNIFSELRRRNIFRVAFAYFIVAWLLLQVSDNLVPALHLPDWFHSGVAFVLIIGFPIAMIFAWAFEMTPEGLKREKEVERRVSIAGETGRKLNYTIIGLMALALLYFAWDKFGNTGSESISEQSSGQSKSAGEKATVTPANSIAVLPFINMSSDKEQEYFSDGLSEELLNLLAKIPELHVAARTSSFSFKGQSIEIPEIASRLKVAHILEGSVRKSGDQIRITAQLIKADNGYHLWSETYDRELDDIFAIQDEIAQQVVNALRIQLLGEVPSVTTTKVEAYNLYLKGKHFFTKSNRESLAAAEKAYREALDVDPRFARAWAGLSFALRNQANWGYIDVHEGTRAARKAAQRALELDDSLAEAWAALAHIQFVYDWDWDRSEGTIRTALQYGPKNDIVLEQAARIMRGLGYAEKAVEYAEYAIELDPLSQTSLRNLVVTYWGVGRPKDQFAAIKRSLELYPDQPDLQAWQGTSMVLQGRPEEALRYVKRYSVSFWQPMVLSMSLSALGRHEEADKVLQQLIDEYKVVMAFQAAEIYAMHGNKDKAYEWLDIAYEQRDGGFVQILLDPFLVSLHDDPRWAQILDKVGLLKYWQELRTRQEVAK